jgi:ABC-type multidrug transport system fused ATPase/permease subunit
VNNGVIAEEGTHEALLKKNGEYAELFEIQSQYYRDKEGAHDEEG